VAGKDPTFAKSICPSLKVYTVEMEEASFFEKSINIYQSSPRKIQEELNNLGRNS
jgi:hypothetical protein